MSGLSCYFPNLSNLENSKMKNGGLEAQRTPDLLFWFMFAIGTQGMILPNRMQKVRFEGKNYRFNPTEVVLLSLASNLELLWYSRCAQMSVPDIITHFQRVCNVSDALYTRMRSMVKVMMQHAKVDKSMKRHIWKHVIRAWLECGSPKTNDADLPEHGHIDDKLLFGRTSKRYESNLLELINMV
jgi:hypothetical protein